MKAPDPPVFPGHGASRFERRGQVLLLYSEGPFNAEHIQSLVPQFRSYGEALMAEGPWATINVVTGSILVTAQAIDMLRRSAAWTRETYQRVAAGYVVPVDVEGRSVVLPILYRCYENVLPVDFFATLEDALPWAHRQIDEARNRRIDFDPSRP